MVGESRPSTVDKQLLLNISMKKLHKILKSKEMITSKENDFAKR